MIVTAAVDGAFTHELVLHQGTPQLLDLMVPFLREGAEADDTLVVVGQPGFVDDLLDAVADLPEVRVVREAGRPRHPGRDLRRFQKLLRDLDRTDSHIRLVNQMPVVTPTEWHEWRRYEAAANLALAPFRVWGACAYDTSTLDSTVLDTLQSSHHHVRSPHGVHPSPTFADLDVMVETYLATDPHPVEATPPTIELVEPTAAAARAAVSDLAARCGLGELDTQTAVFGVSETVTNARRHGRPPVRVRVWGSAGGLTVAVTDSGTGPHPLVGLMPAAPHHQSGHGLWVLHQLVDHIGHRRDDEGYTLRFAVGG